MPSIAISIAANAGFGQCPAGDREIAPQRHLHRTADHGRRIEMELALGIADGIAALNAGPGRRIARGAERHRDLADLAILATHPQCDPVFAAQGPAGAMAEDKPGLPGMRQYREQIADIGALDAELGLADLLAVQQHADRS